MNKEAFLHALEQKLTGLPTEEKEDVLGDLDEYFEEGIRDGKSEEEIAESLGSPTSIAADILSAYPEYADTERSGSRKPHDEYEMIEIPRGQYSSAEVMSQAGSVRVIPSDDTVTRIELIGNRKDLKFDADIVNGKLRITLLGRRGIRSWLGFGSTSVFRLVLHLPKKLYDSMIIKTESGSLTVEQQLAKQFTANSDHGRIVIRQCAFRTIEAATDNGRIEMSKTESDSIRCTTDNGRIEMAQVRSDQTWAETDNGRILMEQIEGQIYGRTDNGRIELSLDRILHPLDLKTDNGSITVTLLERPEHTTIRARSDIGRVEIFGERTRDAVFGDGNIPVKLQTDNGKIIVKQ